MAMRSQVDFMAALSVALQHPAVTSDPKDICTIAQVCKGWRAAAQQSIGGHARIELSLGLLESGFFPQLVGFAAWFPKYQGLVADLSMYTDYADLGAQLDATAHTKMLESMALSILELRMQHAFAAAAQKSSPIQLRSISIGGFVSYGVLSALPAANLTALDISTLVAEDRCMEVIGKLSSLQQLRLVLGPVSVLCPASSHFLTRLQQLTQLRLHLPDSLDDPQLPKNLQQLTITCDMYSSSINLRHLTRLQQLTFEVDSYLAADVALPAQLQTLGVICSKWSFRESDDEIFDVAALPELRAVFMTYAFASPEQLQQLAGHPKLQNLGLEGIKISHILVTAAMWHTIPNLCSLHICFDHATSRDLQLLVRHVTAVVGLTKLELQGQVVAQSGIVDDGDSVCQHLAHLNQLRHLTTWHGVHNKRDPAATGAHHLSVLSALTALDTCVTLITETVAVQLALTLTNLESLCIRGASPEIARWHSTSLPVIGRLTRLRHLELNNLRSEAAKEGLSYLTGLTKLTRLTGFEAAGTDALNAF